MTTEAFTIQVNPDTISLADMRALDTAKKTDDLIAAIRKITGMTEEQALMVRPAEMRQIRKAIQAAWASASDDPN
jgi:hypothetical protein